MNLCYEDSRWGLLDRVGTSDLSDEKRGEVETFVGTITPRSPTLKPSTPILVFDATMEELPEIW